MGFSPELMSLLSGVPSATVKKWRRKRAPLPPFLTPSVSLRPVTYSFCDLLAARIAAFLHHDFPVPPIRDALDTFLAALLRVEQLETCRMLINETEAELVTGESILRPSIGKPNVTVPLGWVTQPFTTLSGVTVPDLRHPAPHLEVNTDILGGLPIITGTLIPYDEVVALVEEGVEPEAVPLHYPVVTVEAAESAMAFHELVQSKRA